MFTHSGAVLPLLMSGAAGKTSAVIDRRPNAGAATTLGGYQTR
jgi:hypothetical protein